MANHRITIFPVMQQCKLIKPFGVERSLLLPCVSNRNFIDLGWCGFSEKSPLDEELFPEPAESAFFLRLYFVDGEIQFALSLYDDSIRASDSNLIFEICNFNNNFNKKFLL